MSFRKFFEHYTNLDVISFHLCVESPELLGEKLLIPAQLSVGPRGVQTCELELLSMNTLWRQCSLVVVILAPYITWGLRCQYSDISFQLMSGYVFTSTDNMMGTEVSIILIFCRSLRLMMPICILIYYAAAKKTFFSLT